MATGIDYAFAHPNLACAAQQGHGFVVRYVGDPDPNPLKYLDAAELTVIRSLGMSVVVVRQTTASFMLTDSGAAHAKAARGHCNVLGLTGIPIYYALDTDPRNLNAGERQRVTQFLTDAAAVDGGRDFVGLYGSDDAIDAWVGTPYCRWGWQTFAWSAGRISPKAHFRQWRNGVALCGGTVDLNETYRDDFGQWPRPSSPNPLPPKPEDVMPFPVIHVPGDPNRATFLALYPGGYETLDAEEYDAGVASGMLDEVTAVSVRQYDVAADLALRMAPPPQQVHVDVDEEAIAAAVVAALPPLNMPGAFEVSFSGAATATPSAPSDSG